MSTANLFNSRAYIPREGRAPGNCPRAAYRGPGPARERGQYLIIPLPGAFGTGCLQKAEPRTLTDMTFLKFAAIYVSLSSLYSYFISPFSCFLFPVWPLPPSLAPLPLPLPPISGSTQSSVFLSLSLLFLLSTSRFPSFVLFHPLVATPTAYIDSPQRLAEEEEEEKEISLFFSLSLDESYFYLLSVFVPSSSERMSETTLERNAPFSKLKTGLSTSMFGPTTNSTVKLNHTFDDFKF